MFKRVLSFILSTVMCFGCFSCITLAADASYNAKNVFDVTSAPAKNNILRYTVNVTSQQKGIAGIVLEVDFDETVLKPVEGACKPASTTTTGNGTKNNFEGLYAYGTTENDAGIYSIAYINDVAVSTNTAPKAFFNLVFEIIDPSKPNTDVSFYCKEYTSVSEPEKNITVENGLQVIADYQGVATLEAPELVSLEPTLEGFKLTWKPVTGAIAYVVYRSSPSLPKTNIGEVLGENSTSYEDTSALKSGETYTYTVTAVNSYGNISGFDTTGLSKMFVAKPQIESVKNVVGGVEIRWGATAGATQYNIMRRENGSTDWKKIAIRVANIDTVYKDTTVRDGVMYEYDIVSATDSFESQISQTGVGVTYIQAPVINSLANTLAGIELKWIAHPNAVRYVIYKKTIGIDDDFKECGESDAKATFVDTDVVAGRSYLYSVKVYTADGESAYNKTGYKITCVPPTNVTKLTPNSASIIIEWTAVEGVDGYYIYRKPTSSTNWIKVGTVSNKVFSYEDKSVDSGIQYVYAVTPIISNSESVKEPSNPIYFIKAPDSIKATNEKTGIALNWDKVKGADIYNVYRKEDSGEFIQIATTEDSFYTDITVSFDRMYTYYVVAINTSMGSSKESLNSNELLRLDAIGKTTATIAEGGIKITWDASPLAESYALYRYNGSQWLLLTQVEATEYIDENVISDQSYAYAVAAVKGTSIGIVNTDSPQYIRYIAPVTTIKVANGANYSQISWNAVEGAISYYLYKADSVDGEYNLINVLRFDELSYNDRDVYAGKEYFYKLQCYNGEDYSVMSIAKKNVFLTKVTVSSVANSYGGQTIKWNAVKGATGYRVYHSVDGKGYVLLTTVSADTLSYFDKTAVNGAKMTYAVRAINGDSVGTYKNKSAVYVAAPKLTLSNSTSGITLKWSKNDVATSYNIYRKVNGKGGWVQIANVQTTSYVDKNVKSGYTYKYTIRAYKGKYLSGYNNNGWNLVRLATPKLKSVTNGYGNLNFTWEKVSGAKLYYVYRKADGDKSWTRIAETTSTYYKDKKVENRAVYKYTVRAINGNSVSSYYSSGKSGRYIEAPKLNVQNATTGIYLTWDRVGGASSYYLYRKAGNATKWTKIDIVTGNSYLDTNVKEGVVYKYTIRTYGSKALSGYNGSGWVTMHLKTPDLTSAKVYGSGIQIKWSKVNYATSYNVYRKERGDKTWTKIATVKGTSYVDKKVEYDDTYTYTVRAVNGKYMSFYKSNGITCRFR